MNKELAYDPEILLLGIYPRKMNTCPHKNFIQMFKAVLLTIAKQLK